MAPTMVATHLHVVCSKFDRDIRRLRLDKCRRIRWGRRREYRCSICKTDKEGKYQSEEIVCHCKSTNGAEFLVSNFKVNSCFKLPLDTVLPSVRWTLRNQVPQQTTSRHLDEVNIIEHHHAACHRMIDIVDKL